MSEMRRDDVFEVRIHDSLVFLCRKSKSSCLILRFSMIASMMRSASPTTLELLSGCTSHEPSPLHCRGAFMKDTHRSVNVLMLPRTCLTNSSTCSGATFLATRAVDFVIMSMPLLSVSSHPTLRLRDSLIVDIHKVNCVAGLSRNLGNAGTH